MTTEILVLTIFPGAMAFAAASDLFTMSVPNRLVLFLTGGFFLVAPLVGLTLTDIGLHVALALGVLAVTFFLFSLGWIGGGDAKLFAATCLWFGPQQILDYGLLAALLGGLLTLLLLFLRSLPLPAALNSQGWLMRLHSAKEGVPYGIALAAAGLLVYPSTPFMAALGS